MKPLQVLALLPLAAWSFACAASTHSSTVVAGDTLTGRAYAVARNAMALQTHGAGTFQLGGRAAVDMLSLANVGSTVEVRVMGRRDGDAFDVTDFEVLAVGGEVVDDGHLLVAGNRVLLATRDGRRIEVSDPPATLRLLPGSRIWLRRGSPRAHPPYGIIVRK